MAQQAGRELDKLVAVKVMGWKRLPQEAVQHGPGWSEARWRDSHGSPVFDHLGPPAYSTDIAAAFLVVEKLKALDVEFSIYYREHDGGRDEAHKWSAWFREGSEYQVYAPTAPLAICLAALQAARQDGEG